jgi:hypothetical protein
MRSVADAARRQGLDDYCAVFQEAGYAAIAFDYAGVSVGRAAQHGGRG